MIQNKLGPSDSAYLSVLRLDHEGISPEFGKDVKEYYFIADNTIQNLEVTAIPENANATVTVTGNTNLKIGKNLIQINVISEDKTKEEVYKIYVTKTTNIELANANLETLAIREVFLNPEFDNNITNYRAEIPNETEKIEILAIPQSPKATVTIAGNNEMKIGDNTIIVNVLAEDGITNKKYELIVHRRNEQEQIEYEEERKVEAEKLSAILEEQEKDNENEVKQEQKRNILSILIVIVVGIIIIAGTVYIVKKNKLGKSN